MARHWKLLLGVIVSVVFLAIALRGLDFAAFSATLARANYWWLIPGVGVYFVAVLVRTWRWRAMLRPLREVSLRELFPIVVIGYAGNNIYPARAGEVLRSYVLRRRTGVPISASLATVVLERLFDGLVMLAFVFVTLPFAPIPPEYLALVSFTGALFVGALLVFLGLAANPARFAGLYARFVDRLVPQRFRERLHSLFDPFVAGLQALRSPRELFTIALASTFIWLTETLKYWFVMHAFPFEVSFPVLMLMTAVVNLFTTLPSTPGYVGTFHAPGIAVLTTFGVAQALATGYTVVLHIALWLPITVLGLVFMGLDQMGWGDFRAAEQLRDEQRAAQEGNA